MDRVKLIGIAGALIAGEVAIFIIAAKTMIKVVDTILTKLMERYKD